MVGLYLFPWTCCTWLEARLTCPGWRTEGLQASPAEPWDQDGGERPLPVHQSPRAAGWTWWEQEHGFQPLFRQTSPWGPRLGAPGRSSKGLWPCAWDGWLSWWLKWWLLLGNLLAWCLNQTLCREHLKTGAWGRPFLSMERQGRGLWSSVHKQLILASLLSLYHVAWPRWSQCPLLSIWALPDLAQPHLPHFHIKHLQGPKSAMISSLVALSMWFSWSGIIFSASKIPVAPACPLWSCPRQPPGPLSLFPLCSSCYVHLPMTTAVSLPL